MRRIVAAFIILAGCCAWSSFSQAAQPVTPACVEAQAGDGWYSVAKAIAGDWYATATQAERDKFVGYLANANGEKGIAAPIYAGQVICFNPASVPTVVTTSSSTTTSTTPTTTATTLPETTTTAPPTTTSTTTTTSPPSSSTTAPSTTSTVPSSTCTGPANTPGGSDGRGGCFPGPANTGTPDGVTLHACATTISAAGTYDLCQFAGDVRVNVAGVSITRSLINGSVYAADENLRGLVISDSTIDCHCQSQGTNDTPPAIGYNNYTLRRVEVTNAGHGATLGSNVTVEDSWIHGLGGNTDAHKDGFYVGDGTNVVIRHNTVECNDGSRAGCTAAIGLLTDFAPVTHFTIDGNLLNTVGSYCFYGSGGPSKGFHSSYITFTNNVFGQSIYPRCGFYGPVTYFDMSQPGMVWSNNRMADGTAVAAAN